MVNGSNARSYRAGLCWIGTDSCGSQVLRGLINNELPGASVARLAIGRDQTPQHTAPVKRDKLAYHIQEVPMTTLQIVGLCVVSLIVLYVGLAKLAMRAFKE